MNEIARNIEGEVIPPTDGPLAPFVEANPVSVLINDGLRARFFAEIEAKLGEFQPDLSTEKGRKAIASFARQYVSTKTAIDAAGKDMNETARAQIAAVDAVRREVREKLDGMRDRARQPLTEWEDAEEKRLEEVKRIMALLKSAPVITSTDTAATVAARIAVVEAIQTDDETLAGMKTTALEALRAGHARIVQDEADRAELAKLRAEREARDRADAKRLAAEQRAKDAAEHAARAEREAKEREEAAANRAAAEAEAKARREAQAEIDRLAAEARALKEAEELRQAEEKRKTDEDERRQKNIRHREAVISKARNTLAKALNIDEETAARIIAAISQGLIPNVTINF